MISTTTALIDIKGDPIEKVEDGKKVDGENLTIGYAIATALLFGKNEDPLRAYILGNRFLKEDSIQLNAADIVYITKSLKTSSYSPLVVGQVIQMLEGSTSTSN